MALRASTAPSHTNLDYALTYVTFCLGGGVVYFIPFFICMCCHILGEQLLIITKGVHGLAMSVEQRNHGHQLRLDDLPREEADILEYYYSGGLGKSYREVDIMQKNVDMVFRLLRLEHLRICKAIDLADIPFSKTLLLQYITNIPLLCFTVYSLVKEDHNDGYIIASTILFVMSQTYMLSITSYYAAVLNIKVNQWLIKVKQTT